MDGTASMREYGIRSYTGSGLTWVMNFLLELDICVFREKNSDIWGTYSHRDTWRRIDANRYVLSPKHSFDKQYLPILWRKTEFVFRDNLEVRWSHELPKPYNCTGKIILLVRDGRDTIYSQYKRDYKNSTLIEMLAGPLHGDIVVTPADAWAIFHLLWTALVPSQNLLVITFEQIKSDPATTARSLLDFIGVTRTVGEVARAIENSTFEKARNADCLYRQTHRQPRVFMRKGAMREWTEQYGQKELAFFSGLHQSILARFGYDSVEQDAGAEDATVIPQCPASREENASRELRSAVTVEDVLYWGWVYTSKDWAHTLLSGDTKREILVFESLLRALPHLNGRIYCASATSHALLKRGFKRGALILAEYCLTTIHDRKLRYEALWMCAWAGNISALWMFLAKSDLRARLTFGVFVLKKIIKRYAASRFVVRLIRCVFANIESLLLCWSVSKFVSRRT